jgi:hypothetical protein
LNWITKVDEGEGHYIVHSAISLSQSLLRAAVADKAVGPDPLDVLHGATRLLIHDIAQAGVVGRGGAVGDGEIATCDVAGEEDVDVVDHGRAVVGVRGELEAAIG